MSTPLKKRCRQSIRRTAISANSRGQARVPGASTRSGKNQAAHVAENARKCMSGVRLDDTCSGLRSGVGTEPPPASRRAPGGGIQEGKIAAGEPGDGEPPRRVSGRRCGRSRGQPCAARCRRRCTAKPSPATHEVPVRPAEALPTVGAAGQGERGEVDDERGAQRRRGTNGDEDTVEARRKCVGAATAVSEASRRASGARSDRRERRREGYPPEGPRPRSGLGRVGVPSMIDSLEVKVLYPA